MFERVDEYHQNDFRDQSYQGQLFPHKEVKAGSREAGCFQIKMQRVFVKETKIIFGEQRHVDSYVFEIIF